MKCSALFLLILPLFAIAQKKPLDHDVYDGWQSIGERKISNDGRWIVYTITPQEGDAILYVQSTENINEKKSFPRGYNATISEDNKHLVFKIKPTYASLREARIKKKKTDEFPKDSLAVHTLGTDSTIKLSNIKDFKLPEKTGGWVAILKEKEAKAAKPAANKSLDSLQQKIDSLSRLVYQLKNMKGGNADVDFADEEPSSSSANSGSELLLLNLSTGRPQVYKNIAEYHFNKQGTKLLLEYVKENKTKQNGVALVNLPTSRVDTILKGNDFKNFVFNESGNRLAFVAERDTSAAPLLRFFGLYLFEDGLDSARLLIDKKSEGMKLGLTISEHAKPSFSKTGSRLLFGLSELPAAKDTTLVEVDLVKVDVWHYKDDYLQTRQLSGLQNELKKSYAALYDFSADRILQLGTQDLQVMPTAEGDGKYFLASTDTGRRVASQWTGNTLKDIYAVDTETGQSILLKKNFNGQVYPSSTGNHILLFDRKNKHYWIWSGNKLQNISASIKFPLYDEDHDVPSDPGPYGLMGWHQSDSAVYVYDKYDVWKIDLSGIAKPKPVTLGRPVKKVHRYIKLDDEEQFITANQWLYFNTMHSENKKSSVVRLQPGSVASESVTMEGDFTYRTFLKAKDAEKFVFSRESFTKSPNLYMAPVNTASVAGRFASLPITALNPQQEQYVWGTSELFHWKTFDGKPAAGVLYKPENFDPSKKYPVLLYFYERVSDNRNVYYAPSPTPSRLNIPFFVSRGYIVFTPDIHYTKGQPGKDAYNYVVSGVRSLIKNKWVDQKNIGIQGQSWGGYQVAHLVTATNMFKAAWAGAPVVNMFSAYGGIRWESGFNRQFQYEAGQSRIGATPWQKPELYIENSPFFQLPKIKTPLVIMANDADGAVPWYQGIEMFTAMRRLGKPVWMLNYNGEAHNLVERKNRKDIQIRQQQFFDWLLKGEKPARWIVEGVPAVKKGKDWGLEIVNE